MPTVFISFASGDKYFVDLLARILHYHHVDIWNYLEKLHVGSDYKDDISKGLSAADHLIVVISRRSSESKWVTREVATFQTMKGDQNIIPLLLDDVDADLVFDGLRNIQSIPFHENMLTGFEKLLHTFGIKEFLPIAERRAVADRRKAPVSNRFRFGVWKAYENRTGAHAEKFAQIMELSTMDRLQFMDAIIEELGRYSIHTRDGKAYDLGKAEIDEITRKVRDELSPREYVTTITYLEAIADEILKRYELKPIDRRNLRQP
jgi:TIR domain